jgi:HEAT repeat protein
VSILALFWVVSWSLCGIALVILIGLVAYRAHANWRAEARRLERAHYIALLKASAGGPGGAVPPAGAIFRAGDVLTDLAVEMLELVRGDEKRRFAERTVKAGAAERLYERLRRGDVRTRILAAAALANFVDEKTRMALIDALDDGNRGVRLTAALSLAEGGRAPPAEGVILKLGLGEQEGSLLTVMLLFEMAQASVGDVRSLLLNVLTAPAIKAAAAEALARCDDFASIPVIAALAMNADPRASELPRYLGALAEFEHPAGSAAVLHCLDSPVAEVRAAAARAAGRIVVDAALDRLERLLGDPDWWVRFRAAHALLRYGDTGEERLQRTARRSDEPAREAAALTLAEHAGAA